MYKPIGVLIIMITRMLGDTAIFIILFTNVTAAFSVTLAGMQKARVPPPPPSPPSAPPPICQSHRCLPPGGPLQVFSRRQPLER